MAKKIKFWSGEKIMSVSAVFISVLTLAVFIYQTDLIRKEQHTAVFPYLELGHSGVNSQNYEFYLENKGIGPALIKKVQIQYMGKAFNKGLSDFVIWRSTKNDSIHFSYSSIYPGRLVSANESVILIENTDDNFNSSDRLHEILSNPDFKLIITYESIYGDAWKIEKGIYGTTSLN